MTKNETVSRNYWVWITKPEYYRGLEKLEVDQPGSDADSSEDLGWWTCHKDTQAGDLVLLYRTSPKSDLAYLLEARSDARILEDLPSKGAIFESDYKKLLQSALKSSPEVQRLHEQASQLKEEIAALDAWLDGGLKCIETTLDQELLQEYNQLWNAIEQLDTDKVDFLFDNREELSTLERIESALRDTFGQRQMEIERRFEEFESRASEQSQVFHDFYEAAHKFDAKTLEVGSLEEGIQQSVLQLNGLDKGTVIEIDPDFSGDYVCDWVLRNRLERPLSLPRLKSEAFLTKEWNALRASFKGRVFRTRPDIWEALIAMAGPDNPGLVACLGSLTATSISPDIRNEQAIEEFLAQNLDLLKPAYDLELHETQFGRTGRQFSCPDAGGFIDLLCCDRATGDYVVVELKANRAGRNVAGQIKMYMGWVKERLAGPDQRVQGLIIADGYDRKLKYALADMENVEFLDLSHFWPPR